MKTLTTLSIAAITAIFIGCGGGSGSSTPANNNSNSSTSTSSASASNGGIFVDSAVKGLNYKCNTSAITGTTDVDGRYECQVGDTTVTFAIGTRNLGTTMIADIITPRSFFNGSGRDDEILNLAQLLQTMDKDGNPNNGIELDETAILNWQSNHVGFDNPNFDTLISQELGKTLVSESVAKQHFNDVLSSMGMSGINPTISSAGSSSSVSSASQSSSSVANAGDSLINANNLAGNTVFIEDINDLGIDIQEYIYVFEAGNNVKVILNRKDGGQVVYDGTYQLKGIVGFKVVDIQVERESFSSGYTLLLDDDSNVKEDQYGYKVTKVLPNASNGVEIIENETTEGALVVNSVNDVKGYTISSNEAHIGTSGATMQLSIEFKCDGTFNYHMDMGISGNHFPKDYEGDEVYIDSHFDTNRIDWHYIDEDGDRSSDSIDTSVNNEILPGKCWMNTNADGSCANDLKIESVTGSGCN